ncbi:glycosyltransferase [Arthrobacter humicola]
MADEKRSIRDHVLLFLERQCINGADLAVTHGEQQLRTVASYTKTKLVSVPLPETSFLDNAAPPIQQVDDDEFARPYALCIGELRENKGIEVAMVAAKAADVTLLVAGKSENIEMSQNLFNLASHHDGTFLLDEFLDKSRFDTLILNAKVVLLPYTHFDAQSGILAKAMKANKTIIASDLPALREQAEGYAHISFVPPGETSNLASELRVEMNADHATTEIERCAEPEHEWKVIAQTLLANV